MAWLAVDGDGEEYIYTVEPERSEGFWNCFESIQLPKGSIKKLIGIELTWQDETVELKGEE